MQLERGSQGCKKIDNNLFIRDMYVCIYTYIHIHTYICTHTHTLLYKLSAVLKSLVASRYEVLLIFTNQRIINRTIMKYFLLIKLVKIF